MKQKIRLCAVALALAVFLSGLVAHAEGSGGAASDMPQVEWLSYTLGIAGVMERPSHITSNPALDGEYFLMVKLVCVGGKIAIRDIIDYIDMFAMEDPDEEVYPALAYFPYNMVYVDRNGVFSTAPEQESFQLLFRLPDSFEMADLMLLVDKEYGGKVGRVDMTKVAPIN